MSLQKDSTYLTIKYMQKVLLPVIHILQMSTQLFHTHNDQHYIIHSTRKAAIKHVTVGPAIFFWFGSSAEDIFSHSRKKAFLVFTLV